MSPREAWAVLGIAPTDDARAVRSAYSARLKAIDVDADPAAFIALRAAFEAATRIAEGKPARRRAASAPKPPRAEPEAPPAARPAPRRRSPWDEKDPRRDARQAILAELRARGRAPDGERIAAALAVLLEPLALERVDLLVETEAWMLETILAHVPRSDAMIAPALRAFGWHDRPLASAEIERVLDRYRDVRYRDRALVDTRGWKALAGPFEPPGPWRFFQTRWAVPELIDRLERERPSLLDDLDPDALQWWRAWRARPRLKWTDDIAIIAVGSTAVGPFYGAHLVDFAGLVVLAALASLVAFAIAWWRVLRDRRIADTYAWDEPPFRGGELGAAALSFALPLAAAYGPGLYGTLFLNLLAGPATVLAGRRFEWGGSDASRSRRRGMPIAAFVLWYVIGSALPRTGSFAGQIPIAAAAVTAFALYPRAADWLRDHRRIERRGAPAICIALAALTVAGVFGAFGAGLVPLALAGVPLLLLVQHLLTAAATDASHGGFYWIPGAGLFLGTVALIDGKPEVPVAILAISAATCGLVALRALRIAAWRR